MKKTLFSFMAVAALTTTAGMAAQAEEVTVKKGDTLSHLSLEHGVTINNLKEWNGLSSDLIYVDQTLSVTSPYYTVKKGDSLWKIGNEYNVTVAELQAWNNISGHLIYPEQKLLVQNNGTTTSATVEEPTVTEETTVVEEQPAVTEEPTVTEETTVVEETPVVEEQSTVTEEPAVEEEAVTGTTMTVTATAYTRNADGGYGQTATGIDLNANPNAKVIAVDPSVIPLGSTVYVEGYGTAIAGDTGGAIKGNKIDVYLPTESEVAEWGRKTVTIKVLD